MIYEVRTYTLKPGMVATFEENFAKALPAREKYSKLGAFWHTEFGPLNQVIHVWPYESVDQRNEIRAEASKDPNWPPANDPDNPAEARLPAHWDFATLGRTFGPYWAPAPVRPGIQWTENEIQQEQELP